ncbi:amino acid adenylation domain-containing protein [Streptomyces sp. NPDC047072]|uniref:amino acid adenylation domain-containing protein n=1 Tax=Streptomyces sp. NPDC047072 TaxID=3154809 RepID=UPI0033CDF039
MTDTASRTDDPGTAPGPPGLPVSPQAVQEARRRALRHSEDRVRAAPLVSDVVAVHARRHPAATALVDAGGTRTSYGRLHELSGRLAGLLVAHGCRAGDRVAVTGPRCADTVAAFLALESVGAVYVPVDAGWPPERLSGILGRTGCAHLLVTGTEPLTPDAAQAAADAGAEILSTADAPRHQPHRRPEPLPDAAARERYIVHTSGSTGLPKGAVVAHAGMVNHLWHMVETLALTDDDVVAFSAPPIHVIAVWQMLAPLLAGATVALVAPGAESFPRPLLRALREMRVTVVQLVPTLLQPIVEEWARHEPAARLPDLRWLIATGEELSPALAGRVLELLPDARLMNAYGMSECSDDVAQHVVTAADLDGARLPVGLPVANAVLHVLVSEGPAWRPARDGESGELFVGGLPVGAGYAGPAGPYGTAFFRDPLDPRSPTGRLYRTGDLARIENGLLHCLGRTDRQVKVGGVRIELDEIERAVEQHPAVSRCAVTAGSAAGTVELSAHVVLTADTPVPELRAFAGQRLPRAMVPRHWTTLPTLPVTRSGKVDYRALGTPSPVDTGVVPQTPPPQHPREQVPEDSQQG